MLFIQLYFTCIIRSAVSLSKKKIVEDNFLAGLKDPFHRTKIFENSGAKSKGTELLEKFVSKYIRLKCRSVFSKLRNCRIVLYSLVIQAVSNSDPAVEFS